MNVSEAKELIERHEFNAERIDYLRSALRALSQETAAPCYLVAPRECGPRSTQIEVPKAVATPLVEAELGKLLADQADIEQRLAAAP